MDQSDVLGEYNMVDCNPRQDLRIPKDSNQTLSTDLSPKSQRNLKYSQQNSENDVNINNTSMTIIQSLRYTFEKVFTDKD